MAENKLITEITDINHYFAHPELYDVTSYQQMELKRNSEMLFNQFQMIAADKKKKIKESIFVNIFLPLFFGLKNFGNGESFEDNNDILIKHYIGIAGSIFSPVDVVSDTTNEVLFEIPPLADRNVLVNINTDTNLGSILDTTALIGKTKPKYADDQRYATLAERVALIDDAGTIKIMKKYLEKWNFIAERYNLTKFVTLDDNKKEESKPIQKDDSDDLFLEL